MAFREQPKSAPQPKPLEQSQQPAATPENMPADEKAFIEKMLENRDAQLAKVDEAFDEKVQSMGNTLSPRALAKMEDLQREQRQAIVLFFREQIAKYREEKKKSEHSANLLTGELMEEAEESATDRVDNLTAILKTAGENVETTEVAKLEQNLAALEKFEQEHPDLQKIFEKITSQKTLTSEDYTRMVELLNTADMAVAQPSQQKEKQFEATTLGLLMAVMTPAQKYELVETFLHSSRGSETPKLLDALMRTGQITRMQAESLLKAMEQDHKPQQKELSQMLKTTDYATLAAEYQQQLKTESETKFDGGFATNRALHLGTWAGLALAGWGGITSSINLLVNYQKGDSFADYVAKIGENIWAPVGAIAAVAGIEMVGAGLKGDMLKGPVLSWIAGLGEDTAKKMEAQAASALAETYTNAPTPLEEYLKKGGFVTMQQVRTSILKKGEKRFITLDQLLAAETDPQQKERLSAMKTLSFITPHEMENRINRFSEAAFAMNITNKDEMESILAAIKKGQKPLSQNA